MNRRRALAMSLGSLAAACAPTLQRAGAPPPGFEGPRLDLGERPAYVAFDGVRLGLTVWPAAQAEPWAVIVALHGMNDYAEAFTLAAPVWAEAGVTTYAYDQRGFGRSPGRGLWADPELLREDLRTAARVARARHPGAVLAIVGESMGGAVAISAFASARPPTADRIVLIAPAVWGWSFQPWLYRTGLWLGAHTLPSRSVTPPDWAVRDIVATDNIEHLRRMGRDRNLLFRTRIDAIYGLVRLMHEAQDGIGRMQGPPAFFAYGANDKIIPEEAAFAAAAKLRRGDRSAYYPLGYHMLTRDLAGRQVTDDVLAFVRDPAAPPPSGAPPIPTAPLGREGAGVVTTAR